MANLSNINNKFLVTDGGNIGIGDTGPTRSLSILRSEAVINVKSSGVGGHSMIILDHASSANNYSQVRFSNAGSAKFAIGIDPQDSYKFKIVNDGNATGANTRVSITTGGNAIFSTTLNQGGITATSSQDNVIIGINNTATGGQAWRLQSTGGSSGLGAGKLFLKVGGTEAAANLISFVTDSSGNNIKMGIGTTSPTKQLHLLRTTGDVRGIMVETTVATSYAEVQLKAASEFRIGTGGSSTVPNGQFYVYDATSGAHRLDITANGNVGMGTTSPGRGLTINRTNEFASLDIIKNNTGRRVVYLGTGSSGAEDLGILILEDVGVAKVQIYSGGDSWFNGGDVGIGTTGPEQKLHVEGRGIFDGGNSSDILQIRNNNGGGVFGMTANQFALDLASASAFRIRQGSSVPFYIKSDGNVGIGYDSPNAKLEIYSTATFNSRTSGINVHRPGSYGQYGSFSYNSDTTYFSSTYTGGGAGFYGSFVFEQFNNGSVGREAMRIITTGDIGIGTPTPTGVVGSGQAGNSTLDVQGPLKNKRVMRGWYFCGPITSSNAYRHIKTNLHMGGGARGNDEYIMGGFEIKGYAYYGSYPGFGHGTCMFHNWSNSFASLQVANYGTTGFLQQPYISSDGYCVIVTRQNNYMQPVIDFAQYYTPYPWRTSYVTAETTSNNLTGVY